MSAEYREKLKSLGFSRARARQPKTTVDVHDHHTVEVTEHWHDRQDVTVKPDTVRIKPRGTVHGA